MQPVTIYTKSTCGYCHRAKALLTRKNVAFDEISVDGSPDRQQEMTRRSSGGWTVPQIFVGETHVGGCDELYALDRAGKLDPLLEGAAS
jgi:glutaredoxin 3